jgi:hypothetical protein
MKIIDIGVCVDNMDPKAIGRIRYRPYGLFVSEIANSIKYDKWDENDPFIAIPFLPLHINITPKIQQSVKIIKYDTDKDTQNIEYIAGPYTSPHDLQDQTFSSQHKDTTYGGVIVKAIKDIRSANGKFNDPASPSAITNQDDIGIHGNYGSDIIFTEDGLQLRGGMLISKKGKVVKSSLYDYPQLSKKMGRFSLKKFPTTIKSFRERVDSSSISVSKIKYIIEYEIDSLSAPSQLKLFVYKIIGGYGTQFNTDVFAEDSVFSTTDATVAKLINTGNTLTDASYIKSLDGTINGAALLTRDLFQTITNKGLTVLYYSYPSDNIYPVYFRPTANFKLLKGTNPTEISNKQYFLSKINFRSIFNGLGLIFSQQSPVAPIVPGFKLVDTVEEILNSGEQSFSNLSADKIYITSTSPNTGVNINAINFNELNDYELTQDDYINKIDPNTYAMVRGEILYEILIAIKNLIDSHRHNINTPLIQSDPNWTKLNSLIETLRNDLLNDSVRIN